MSGDQLRTEPLRLGGIEFRDRSSGGGSAGNGRSGNGPAGADFDTVSGPAIAGDQIAASEVAKKTEQAVANLSHVPAGILQDLRQQVADFADFAHRGRSRLPDLQALGSGGGITAEVVGTMAAELIGSGLVPSPSLDVQVLCDSLTLALVAPGDPVELTARQRECFLYSRGQLMLDVSAAEVGSPYITRLVAPPAQPRTYGNPAPDADDGVTLPPAAAVIIGAAAIAERPFLGLDMLLSHARRAVFRQVSPGRQAQTAGSGMRAARNLEIVVLLERSLGGGVWIDIDPATGRPTAALAIALPAPPATMRFTHIPLAQPRERDVLTAGRARR